MQVKQGFDEIKQNEDKDEDEFKNFKNHALFEDDEFEEGKKLKI